MNRSKRRKAESIKRKIGALTPAARELAIQTGMELHDALADKRKQEIRSMVEKEWASKYGELYKKVSDEQANRFAERVAEVGRKAREYQSDVVRWRRAYLTTYLAGFASGKPPEPQGCLTSMEAVEAATHDFKDRLKIIESRVEKDAGHFDQPELLYGVLRWLATTYHGAKTGVNCPDLDESCRRASGFRYAAHQSEVTMGQYKSDYEITWRGKVVKLREHVGFGTSRDPRHTIRVAFFFDDRTKRVVVGYVGLHQQNRAT
jgi:hypothetical protein